jgi:hypothetical protein
MLGYSFGWLSFEFEFRSRLRHRRLLDGRPGRRAGKVQAPHIRIAKSFPKVFWLVTYDSKGKLERLQERAPITKGFNLSIRDFTHE